MDKQSFNKESQELGTVHKLRYHKMGEGVWQMIKWGGGVRPQEGITLFMDRNISN